MLASRLTKLLLEQGALCFGVDEPVGDRSQIDVHISWLSGENPRKSLFFSCQEEPLYIKRCARFEVCWPCGQERKRGKAAFRSAQIKPGAWRKAMRRLSYEGQQGLHTPFLVIFNRSQRTTNLGHFAAQSARR
jgi:hypothetical protein